MGWGDLPCQPVKQARSTGTTCQGRLIVVPSYRAISVCENWFVGDRDPNLGGLGGGGLGGLGGLGGGGLGGGGKVGGGLQ